MSAAAIRWVRGAREPRFDPAAYGAAELQRLHPVLLRRALLLACSAALLAVFLLSSVFSLWRPALAPVVEIPDPDFRVLLREPVPPPTEPEPPRPNPPSHSNAGVPLEVPDAVADTSLAPPEAEAPGESRTALGRSGESGSAPSIPTGLGGSEEEEEEMPMYADELPVPVVRVPPVYPDLARQAGLEGTVVVHALVGIDGRVRRVRVMTPHPVLEEAAREAVRAWIFAPAKTAGRPVEVWVAVPVRFTLR